MKLRLTDREKILLTVLSICLVVAALYYAAIKPQLDMVSTLQNKAREYSVIIKDTKAKASLDHPIYKEYKVLNAKTQNLLQRFYPSIIQEEFILLLDEKINKSGIAITSITFLESEQSNVVQKKEKQLEQITDLEALTKEIRNGIRPEQKKQENNNAAQEQELTIDRMTISIEFTGSYSQVYSFLNEIELENRSISCNELNLSSINANILSGIAVLDFYAIPKPFDQEEDKDYLNWDITDDYGKLNPFGFIQGNLPKGSSARGPVGASLDSPIELDKNDFFISIRPISSDLPTITMGRFGDQSRSTYIYADNSSIEPLELQLVKDNGKYYFKYKTQSDSYPVDYDRGMIEFVPTGEELRLVVLSSSRNKEKDINGASLSITNRTDLPMKIIVQGDDKNLPRFKTDKLEGNVSVINP